jgi:hypothetical protein
VELLCPTTPHAAKVVPYLGPEFPFRHLQWFLTSWIRVRDPNTKRVDAFVWSSAIQRILLCEAFCVQVWVRKSVFPFLRILASLQLFPRWQPLIGEERLFSFANLRCPTRSAVDHFGSGGDELDLPTSFVLFQQPSVIPMPGVPSDVLNILYEAGVSMIIGLASDNRIEGSQPRVLIHPCPASASEGFDLLCDALFRLLCGSKMHCPMPFRPHSLDVKSQKSEAVIDVSDERLFLREFKVQLGFQEVFDLLLHRFNFAEPGIADHDKI